jgi:hypothetical protein
MNVIVQDLQEPQSAATGHVLSTPADVAQLFESFRGRAPFMFELVGERGNTLTIGYSDTLGAVQHAPSDGPPPYLMAVNEEALDDEVFVEFLAGGTPTPIASRFCLPIQRVLAIAQEFVATGERSNAVTWDEI